MKKPFLLLLGATLTFCMATIPAHAHGGFGGGHGGFGYGHGGWGHYGGWGYGGIGIGLYGYGPYYPGYYGYGGYPYAYPGPVVVQQPPMVMPAPAYAQAAPVGFSSPSPSPNVAGSTTYYGTIAPAPNNVAPPSIAAPTFSPNSAPASGVVATSYSQAGVNSLMQQLSQANENARQDAAIELGKMKAECAVDTLARMLANDSSPVARDACARALGLIGTSRCLPPLIRAAVADSDRDVRRSAQFAIEVIRSQFQR